MDSMSTVIKLYPTDNDVLCGRGNGVNLHPGNQRFRAMIKALKPEYVAASKPDKSSFPYLVVAEIQNATPAGRFMKYSPKEDQWHQLPTKQAITKTRQALREGAPDIVESQKVEKRNSAVYIVDEIKKIVRDAGRSHVPVPSTRGIPCPKATNDGKSSKKSSSPSTKGVQNGSQNRELPRQFDDDSIAAWNYQNSIYKRPRLANDDNYSIMKEISDHTTSTFRPSQYYDTTQRTNSAYPSFRHVDGALPQSPKDTSTTCSNGNMQSLPSQYIAAAALLDLSHRTYTGGKKI